MNVFQKPIDSVFGKIFMESSNFHLIVHAHRREHEIEDVEQDDFYGDSFFLIGPTFSEKLYPSKAVSESGCGILTLIQITLINAAIVGLCF